MEGSKPNVLLMITNNFAALNVIHSGLIKYLAAEYNLFLLSDLIGKQDIAHINRHFNINVQLTTASLRPETRWIRWLRLFQKALFCHLFQIKTLQVKIRERGACFYLVYQIFTIILKIRYINAQLLALARQWIIVGTAARRQDTFLDGLNLRGVISTSPLDVRENQMVNFLKKRHVKSAAIVISWDNLSSKGVMNADHDIVVVWNNFMAGEYRLYDAVFKTGSRICIGGIPRFDLYFNTDAAKLCAFREKWGIKPFNKVILLATSSVKHIPSHSYIIWHLLEYMKVAPEIVLLVRCHPGDCPENYEAFRDHPNVHCFAARPNAENSSALLPMDFLATLQMQLEACHVCIQVASTMRIDAAACNKPVISIAYDAGPPPNARSVSQLYSYSHQTPLNNLHIDRMACDKHDLFCALDELLDPLFPKPDYRKMIEPFIHRTDRNATSLTTQHLQEWLRS